MGHQRPRPTKRAGHRGRGLPARSARTAAAVIAVAAALAATAEAHPTAPVAVDAASAHPVTLTVVPKPSDSVERMTSRDQGATTIIEWPSTRAQSGPMLVIDNCLHFGQQCGQPAADAACRLLMPGRPVAAGFSTAKPRGGATVVLGARLTHCWDKACVGFRELRCVQAAATAPPPPARPPAPPPQARVPDPRTCKPGFVWRTARPADLVCVPPESRDRVAAENAAARSKVDPAGAYGPASCIAGYVWREAFGGDTVCVTPEVRDLVREENRLAPTRRVGG